MSKAALLLYILCAVPLVAFTAIRLRKAYRSRLMSMPKKRKPGCGAKKSPV